MTTKSTVRQLGPVFLFLISLTRVVSADTPGGINYASPCDHLNGVNEEAKGVYGEFQDVGQRATAWSILLQVKMDLLTLMEQYYHEQFDEAGADERVGTTEAARVFSANGMQ